MTPSQDRPNNTQTIARNFFWYGLEMMLGIGTALVVSIVAGRKLGPERLGYYNYLMFLTNISAGVGGAGLSVTVRKYMAEYLNRDQVPVARAIYQIALKYQLIMALSVTAVGVALVFLVGKPDQQVISLLLVLNMTPRMIAYIPSQANVAAERMKLNTGPSFIGGSLNVIITLTSLEVGWNLYGMAAAFAVGSALELFFKLYSVHRWLGAVPPGEIPAGLRKKLFSYSGQGLVLMLLNIVVWDRSDVLVLQHLSTESQVTFFATSFGLTDRMLMMPSAFSGALGATMMAQFGRAEERVRQITVSGAKYAFLVAVPLLVGLACISSPFVRTAFHSNKYDYTPMIPVLAVAAILAIPKALNAAPTSLLQTVDRQGYLIWTGCICGALDFGLDFLLIPRYGALGAAWANGLAQTLATVLLWTRIHRDFQLKLRFGEFSRIAFSGAVMAAAVLSVQRFAPLWGIPMLVVSIATGALTWFVMLRFAGVLNKTDGERIRHIGRRLPESVQPMVERCLSLLSAS